MRANCVGTTIIGDRRFSFRSYILSKYDGLMPDDYPSKHQYNEAVAGTHSEDAEIRERSLRTKRQYDRRIKVFQREWVRQQKPS